MDRFIERAVYDDNFNVYNLKSNMDRFIVDPLYYHVGVYGI